MVHRRPKRKFLEPAYGEATEAWLYAVDNHGAASGRVDFQERMVMSTFQKREEGFEKKFAHDEELKFKAMARRNKMLGLWAAGQLGKSGPDAEAYAKSVILADFEEAGDDDVLRKVKGDFDAAGIAIGEQQIRVAMDEMLAKAIADIRDNG
jgi:hypothetical protein